MTTLFQRTTADWRDIGGLDTAEEIAHQPAMWRELSAHLSAEQRRIAAFLGDSLRDPQQRVILTGAGSSAYIGEIIADEINAAWPCQVRAIPTTSLLSHPALYLETGAPTLLVSFGRSGNSPESTATVRLVRDMVPNARFLNITCNADGDLATQSAGDERTLNLMMPAASCDRGFAMTSSLTCMLLAALCALDPDFNPGQLSALADLGAQALEQWSAPVAELSAQRVSRVIYLGSGPLEALAKEAALKILELTAGSVMAMSNSALGFRHGPKAAVTRDTLVVMFRSADPLARRYEQDLLDELRRDQVASRVLTVGADGEIGIDAPSWPDAWLAPLWLLMAQQYALHQSALLQLRPDNPFTGGIVNRVVQGVTIYRHDEF
ncbi:SIS domain-containing protein [Duganella callida]|uniref:SIS domain-containing protein n=1 Tax=Duganella callida TaxID=2561932 RepID=A0A4Y9SDQ2_9BURK|nr:SIS domain-containing protein [Duganella callida]TFW17994.1 SIS domain-containing protein [Duganella callida]